MDASLIMYTGIGLTYIGVTPNQKLDVILGEINTAVNNLNPSPNYSSFNYGPYHGYTITTTTGGVPANAQQFVEGISKIVTTDEYNLANFIGSTYANDQGTIGTAITGLQVPGLTYSTYSITNTMTVTQTWNALFAGLTGTIGSIDPYSANWSTLSITPEHTVVGQWNNVIVYLSTLHTSVAGKQAQIATFDNSANCLSGGSTDSIYTTVGELITYTCGLPTFDNSSITYGGVSAGTNLQSAVQNTITAVSYLLQHGVIAAGTGLTSATVGSTYQGYKLLIDTSYTQLYKTMVSTDAYTDAGFLDAKIVGDGTTISTSIVANQIVITSLVASSNYKIKVNSSDSTPDYIATKIPSVAGTWGLAIIVTPSSNNEQLIFTPQVINPDIFVSSFLSYISTNPALLAQFCELQTQCAACTCAAPGALTVSFTTGPDVFDMAWTVGGSPVSQIAQYRQRGDISWISNVNITPANPQTDIAVAATVSNLAVNTVYQFQVESVCSAVSNGGNIYESIIYACQTLTAVVTGSSPNAVISVNQSIMPTVDTIQYQLLNSSNVVVDSKTATGLNPNANFAPQSSDTYHVKWRVGTLINGTILYSDDSSQLNAMCSKTGIVVA